VILILKLKAVLLCKEVSFVVIVTTFVAASKVIQPVGGLASGCVRNAYVTVSAHVKLPLVYVGAVIVNAGVPM
jgi:hypothetical protein